MTRDEVLDYLRLVGAMRVAQIVYFRTRTGEALSNSKQVEREVDKETARLLKRFADGEQLELF